MRNARLFLIGILAAVLVVGGLALARLYGAGGDRLETVGPAPDFVLTDQLGRTVRSQDLAGKAFVANFIFTQCPDICPLLTRRMADLQEHLAAAGLLGERVLLLSFSVDPDNDTPPVLRRYAEANGARHDAWRFLTGPRQAVRDTVITGFRLSLGHFDSEGDHGHGTVILHSNRFVLVDGLGRIRTYYEGETLDPAQVVRDLRRL